MSNSDQDSVLKNDFERGSAPADVKVVNASALASARRKFDFFVLPVICIYFLLSFLDRSNISNARTAGMQKELHLTNHQFSVALTVTFVPYIAIEIPSTLIIKKFGPHRLLPLLVFSWGLVTTFTGFVDSYAGLIVSRFLIGLFEGGLIPCMVLYLAEFYRRLDLHSRVAVLFTAPALAGAFSGLLAFGIQHLNGKGGKSGWRWIFFLEGMATCVIALASLLVLHGGVATVPFLTEEERESTLTALRADKAFNEEVEPLKWREIWSVFTSPQLIILTPAFFANGLSLLGLGFFATSIINSLGYSPGNSQLMSVPPYACAFAVSVVSSIISDRYRARGFVIMFAGLCLTIGYAIFLGTTKKHVRYGALFFQISGGYIGAPALCAWIANNVMPHFRRGTALSLVMMWANVGGIVSTWTFNDPPKYHKPATINLVFSIIYIFSAGGNILYLHSENNRRAKERQLAESRAHPEDKAETLRLGDRHRDFVYTL